MQQGLINTNSTNKALALAAAEPRIKSFNKEVHVKNCKYRTADGFCTRSSRTCPATLFTLTFNN